MGEKRNDPAVAGPSELSLRGDGSDDTARRARRQHDRFDRAGRLIGAMLELVPAAGEPGFPSLAHLLSGTSGRLIELLKPEEAFALAVTACDSLLPEDAETVAQSILEHLHAGAPPPPFTSPRREAAHWAEWASPQEHREYLSACWRRLSASDRQAFLRAVLGDGRAAA